MFFYSNLHFIKLSILSELGGMTPAAVSGLLVRRTGLVTVKRCMGR